MQKDSPNDSFGQSVDEKLFRLLVDSVKDYAIFMIDPAGYIMSWNYGAARIKGYREEEIIGKHISIFYTPEDIENNEPQYNLDQALKKGTYESEGWRVRKNGSIFWANILFTPLFDGPQHIGFAKVTRDCTERKIAEEQKATMHNELEKRVKQQTEQIISSELRFRKLIENSYSGIALLDENFMFFIGVCRQNVLMAGLMMKG